MFKGGGQLRVPKNPLVLLDEIDLKPTMRVRKSDRTSDGGEGGIRTPGPLRVNGFQDRRYRPLSHLSKFHHI